MKRLLKKLFSESQWKRLVAWRDHGNSRLAAATAGILRFLPNRFLIELRARLGLRGKMDYPRGDIFLHVDSRIEYDIRLRSCAKEPETIQWIESFFREGDVFFDIGANIGAYSLVASKFLRGRVRVFALEPAFLNFSQLCRNILLNDCSESITPLQIGLSDRTEITAFHYQNVIPGGALHALGAAVDYKGEVFRPVFQQQVFSYRLDDLMERFRLPPPNHIKIDVDGNEPKILTGAARTLGNPALRSVLIEVETPEEGDALSSLLKQHGLALHSRHRFAWAAAASPYENVFNYIFTRADGR